jgi:hypothetical protein
VYVYIVCVRVYTRAERLITNENVSFTRAAVCCTLTARTTPPQYGARESEREELIDNQQVTGGRSRCNAHLQVAIVQNKLHLSNKCQTNKNLILTPRFLRPVTVSAAL